MPVSIIQANRSKASFTARRHHPNNGTLHHGRFRPRIRHVWREKCHRCHAVPLRRRLQHRLGAPDIRRNDRTARHQTPRPLPTRGITRQRPNLVSTTVYPDPTSCSRVLLLSFVVAFTLPYLLNAPYANLQSKVGFIFGSLAFCATVFVYFFLPECKGRSFEEVDRMFREHFPLRKFHKYDLSDKESIEVIDQSFSEKRSEAV
jgi:hypothetical protein